MKSIMIFAVIALIKIMAIPELIFAQTSIEFKGIVVDDTERAMPYVNVYILNSNDGAMTDEKGDFSFHTNLKGEVILTASMVGYGKYQQKIKIEGQKEIELKIQLKEEAVKLQESIVMGSSFGSVKEKGVVLTSRDVYTTPGGAADIFQSLKTLPGLTQVSESAQLYVRGGDPIETLTMVDGASLYHPYTYESAYGGLFSNLNTSTVKEMYFSSGGFSTKYGNVLSGVLDIETKNEPDATNFLIGISMAAVGLNGEIPLVDDKLGVRFFSKQSYTKPIMWFNGALDEFTAAPSSRDLSLSLIYRYSKTGRLKLFGLTADDKQGVNIDRAEYDGVFNGNSSNNFINLQHTDVLASNFLLKNSLSFNRHTNLWKLGIMDFNQSDEAIKLRTDTEYQVTKSLKLLSGFEAERRMQKFKGVIPEEDYDVRPEAVGEFINANIKGSRFGIYGELELKKLFGIENVFAVAGIRSDYIPELNLNWIDPRGGIGYKLSEGSSLKFAWGIFHQLPDSRLFSDSDGNPDLQTMRAYHYVLSYDLMIDDRNTFRIEAYHKEYKNLPLENTTLNYDNSGRGFATGIDLIAKGRFPFGLEGWISYGLINTKRQWMEFEELTSSDFDVTHNLSVVANYHLSAMWKIGINYKFATGRPYTPVTNATYHPDENIYEPIYGVDNSSRYPNYHRLDLRITHLNQFFHNYFTVFYIEALNILDITNLFGYSYSSDYSKRERIKSYFGRRTIVLGAQITF